MCPYFLLGDLYRCNRYFLSQLMSPEPSELIQLGWWRYPLHKEWNTKVEAERRKVWWMRNRPPDQEITIIMLAGPIPLAGSGVPVGTRTTQTTTRESRDSATATGIGIGRTTTLLLSCSGRSWVPLSRSCFMNLK